MIIDTSAIIAIVRREPGWEELRYALEVSTARMSAGTLAELLIVTGAGMSVEIREAAMSIVRDAGTEIVSLTADDASAAADAYLRFGKGKHPAKLNMGDCFAYALAKRTGEPLLCVGEDFPQADLPLVPLP